MDELLKFTERLQDQSSTFTVLDIVLVLGMSFCLSLAVGWVYRYTHRGVSYSQSYVHTLVIMGTVVSLIMLIIGSNLARAFALVGSLSIIRFRNAVKETRDVGFIFIALAIGMAVGTRFYLLAIFATAILSAIAVALYRFNMFAKEVRERLLRIQFPIGLDYETALREPFRSHLDEHRLISVETVRAGALQELVYSVVLKPRTLAQRLLEDIRTANAGNKVTLILGQQEIDI